MPDYKKMYLRLFQASEDAINLLVEAQRECEEMFLADETQQPISCQNRTKLRDLMLHKVFF